MRLSPTLALSALLLLVSCAAREGENRNPGGAQPAAPLEFEVAAPPVTGQRLLPSLIAARGDTVIVQDVSTLFSLDGRRTWAAFPLNAHAISRWEFITDSSGVFARTDGVHYMDLVAREQRRLNVPSPVWTVVGDQLVALEEIEEDGAIRPRLHVLDAADASAAWLRLDDLPLTVESDRTYLPSLHPGHDGTVAVVTRYGLLQGRPEPGASWDFHPIAPGTGHGVVLGWADNEVWVSRSGTIFIGAGVTFDRGPIVPRHQGGDDAPWEHQDDGGVLYYRDLRSEDGGLTWEEFLPVSVRERITGGHVRGSIQRRGNDTYLLREVPLVVSDTGRIQILASYLPDEGGRVPLVVYERADGSFLAEFENQLVTFTPGADAWEWHSSITRHETLRFLRHQDQFVLFTQADGARIKFSSDGGDTWSEAVDLGRSGIRDMFSLPDQAWALALYSSCRHEVLTSRDSFASSEVFMHRVIVSHPSLPQGDGWDFFPVAITATGGFVGTAQLWGADPNVPGYRCKLQRKRSVLVTDPDGMSDELERVPLAANSRGDLISLSYLGREHNLDRHEVFLTRNGSTQPVSLGLPVLKGSGAALTLRGLFMRHPAAASIDRNDRLLFTPVDDGPAYGVMRSVLPMR